MRKVWLVEIYRLRTRVKIRCNVSNVIILVHYTTLQLQPFYDPLSGIVQLNRYQNDKPFWILLKQT